VSRESGASESALESSLLELELLLLLLLLESSPGRRGAGLVGNGCSLAAEEGVVVLGLGESGGAGELAGAPGNGNCSAAEGFLASGAVQGLAG
jgi:hypothetical protein